MLRSLATLVRYRGLVQTLVVRDLKARYRGSVLGFFWSFINPMLQLAIYSFVFTVVMPGIHSAKPTDTISWCFSDPWRYHIWPVRSEEKNGVCPGSTPKSPSAPGSATSSTS